MAALEQRLESYIKPLDQALAGFLPRTDTPQKTLAEAMAYSLLSGGKRIRGTLLLATYEMFGGDFHAAIPFAAAVEMVHAYSLIHDDLPCMDDDDLRRGKPSCHVEFGEAAALLAGDGLLTLAFETLSFKQNEDAFGAEKTLAAIRSLSAAAGAAGMAGGQMIDLENEDSIASVETLTLIDSKKTGALIKSACEIGCILGGADAATTAHVLGYAEKLGLAFQVVDDILDVTADEKQLGKPVGSDKGNKKGTYASLYGIERAKEIAVELTSEAIAELDQTGLEASFLSGLAELLADRTR